MTYSCLASSSTRQLPALPNTASEIISDEDLNQILNEFLLTTSDNCEETKMLAVLEDRNVQCQGLDGQHEEVLEIPRLDQLVDSLEIPNQDFPIAARCKLLRRNQKGMKSLVIDFTDQNGERVGIMNGSIFMRMYSVEPDERKEQLLQHCERWVETTTAMSTLDSDSFKPMKVLHISKLVVDAVISFDSLLQIMKKVLRGISHKFDVAILDIDQLAASALHMDPDVHLLRTAEAWTLWQRVGFRTCTSMATLTGAGQVSQLQSPSNSLLLLSSSNALHTSPSNCDLEPFTPSVSTLQGIETKFGAARLTESIRNLSKLEGIQIAPSLLSRSQFVMDEWGYIGRVTNYPDSGARRPNRKRQHRELADGEAQTTTEAPLQATVVYWGHHWDMETFAETDVKLGLTRRVIPCGLDTVALRKRSRMSIDLFLNRLNVKVWQRGNGWSKLTPN